MPGVPSAGDPAKLHPGDVLAERYKVERIIRGGERSEIWAGLELGGRDRGTPRTSSTPSDTEVTLKLLPCSTPARTAVALHERDISQAITNRCSADGPPALESHLTNPPAVTWKDATEPVNLPLPGIASGPHSLNSSLGPEAHGQQQQQGHMQHQHQQQQPQQQPPAPGCAYLMQMISDFVLLPSAAENQTTSAALHPSTCTSMQSIKHGTGTSMGMHSCSNRDIESVVLVLEPLHESLSQVLRYLQQRGRGGLPPEAVRNLARQSLVALDTLHRVCSVAHLDVKPSNLLLVNPFITKQRTRAGGPGGASGEDPKQEQKQQQEQKQDHRSPRRTMSAVEVCRATWKLADYGNASELQLAPVHRPCQCAAIKAAADEAAGGLASRGRGPWWLGFSQVFQGASWGGAREDGSSGNDLNLDCADINRSSSSSSSSAGTGLGAATRETAQREGRFMVEQQQQQLWQVVRPPPYDTPSYSAPEIVLQLPITPAADIWALGCTLFEAATGQVLFGPGVTLPGHLLPAATADGGLGPPRSDWRWKGGGGGGSDGDAAARQADGVHLGAMEVVSGGTATEQMIAASPVAFHWYTLSGRLQPSYQGLHPLNPINPPQHAQQGRGLGPGSPSAASKAPGLLRVQPLQVMLEEGRGLGGGGQQQQPGRAAGQYKPNGMAATEAAELSAFLGAMLVFNPSLRPSAQQLLEHPYITQQSQGR